VADGARGMQVLQIGADRVDALPGLPASLPAAGFVWIAFDREGFEAHLDALQALLQRQAGGALVELHVADLRKGQLPSHFDDTSWYDLLVFRRLLALPDEAAAPGGRRADAAKLTAIDTRPIGFACFDRLLLSVHSADGDVRAHFAQRLQQLAQGSEGRNGSRLPTSPSDLMLRMVNQVVDSYLDLRRLLTRELGELQRALLDPKSHRHDWQALLDARNTLHLLEDTCEDQRGAMQEWIDAFEEWPAPAGAAAARERELLRVRARDVLEHIERVLVHVRRLESGAETAVQMHFAAVGQRTNDVMRTLTVITSIFLPLNLITGIFGMNFDALPLIHRQTGFWIAMGVMALAALGLGAFFWRNRYLSTHERP
jgi:Mg2+ and Co2+ transporter CorA